MAISYSEIRKRCLKPDEAVKPVYARLVTHTFSTRFVWAFQDAPFTPNSLTFVSLVFAFVSMPYFASMTPAAVLAGAIFVELYYIFDAADGQWARFKNQKSLTGAFFDFLINYAMQPPLLFAIGWGVYRMTGDVRYILYGFLSGFSTLWIILIWNLRSSVLLQYLASVGRAPKKPASETIGAGSPAKREPLKIAFGFVHKTMVFPWFMNVLTLTSVIAFICAQIQGDFLLPAKIFAQFLKYYGIAGPLLAVLITAWWIRSKKIDSAPEIQL